MLGQHPRRHRHNRVGVGDRLDSVVQITQERRPGLGIPQPLEQFLFAGRILRPFGRHINGVRLEARGRWY